MNFGQALELLKDNKKATRKSWGSRYLFIHRGAINAAYVDENESGGEAVETHIDGVKACLFEAIMGDLVTSMPYICLFDAYLGSIVNGWLASQTDMLAEDWEEVI